MKQENMNDSLNRFEKDFWKHKNSGYGNNRHNTATKPAGFSKEPVIGKAIWRDNISSSY